MAFQMAAPNRQPSPAGLTLNLSSNNPFRNRAASPSPNSASALHTAFPLPPQPSPRPMSRNPFLDDSDFPSAPPRNGSVANTTAVPDDIFSELSLLDRPNTNEAVPRAFNGAQVRSGMPPPPRRPQGPLDGSRERPVDPRDRQIRGPPRAPENPSYRQHRPRRASESSVMEKERRPRMERDDMRERTESSERRRRERRAEREERHRREKEKTRNGDKTSSSSSRSKKPRGLDIIDKLDVTGIYGQGLFHHDGPFDACNPHRNAKKDRRAPMEAFPVGSANMALGGAGPVSSRLDLDKFHGRGQESFTDYAVTRKVDTTVVDPTLRAPPVHGEESYGLGTSTFLDGAPASKNALQRRVSEDPATEGPGLSRKKSIAQRFRGMSGSRPNRPGEGNSPPSQIKAMSAGGPVRARYNKENEVNPFDNDYESAFEKKGTQIRIAEQERPSASTHGRNGSSPKAPLRLTRSRTSEQDVPTRGTRRGSDEDERPGTGTGGGFLSRMKSLKGGPRRPRNDAY